MTLPQIGKHQKSKAPLHAVDPETAEISDSETRTSLLTEEVFAEAGITLNMYYHILHPAERRAVHIRLGLT